MPSTFTNNAGIELPADGEKDGVWGDVVNLNMQIVDRLTNGVGAVSLTGASSTLVTSDGTLNDGQYAVLVFGGSPSGTHTVTIQPDDAQKIYFVKNETSEDVVITQGSGGNATVAAGSGAIVYANGAGTGSAVVDLTAVFVPDLAQAGVTASVAELNLLDGVAASTAELNQLDGNAFVGNITVTGTVDGRDVAADGTKLDGIEAGATADQTAGEIKTAYESNANTNAFTDAEQTKLAGIETGATADQTITAGTGLTGGGTGDVTLNGVTQDIATWEAGTGTTESLVSPAKVKAAGVASFADQEQQIGVGQTWQVVSRSSGTAYQNTTGKPIVFSFRAGTGGASLQVSVDNLVWQSICITDASSGTRDFFTAIIPPDYYYRGNDIFDTVVELR